MRRTSLSRPSGVVRPCAVVLIMSLLCAGSRPRAPVAGYGLCSAGASCLTIVVLTHRRLLMADDGMGHVRLFQVGDLVLAQCHGQRAHGILQMPDLRGPDDRRHHRLLL